MPAQRKNSLERYIPPRRSDVSNPGNPNDSFEQVKSPREGRLKSQSSFSEIRNSSFELTNWNDEIDLEMSMNNMAINNWVEETEKVRQEPQHRSFSPQSQVSENRAPSRNSMTWDRRNHRGHNNRHNDHGEWYQSLGRGRGRGYPPEQSRTSAQNTLRNRNHRKNSQDQLSPRHRGRGGDHHDYRDHEQFHSLRDDRSRYNDADDRWSVRDDDQRSIASFDGRKQHGDLRQRLNKKNSGSQNFGSQNFGSQNFNQHDARYNDDRRDQRHSEARTLPRQSEERSVKGNNQRQERRENRHKDQRRNNRDERNNTTNKQQLARPKKNTENFNPSHEAPEMRILFAPPGRQTYKREYSTRDVLIVSDLFGDETDMTIYNALLKELTECGIPEHQLWQSWHGDSHVIADDKRKWKESCPTFDMVMDRIKNYFNMDIKATRLNWYRDTSEWKPFHHDAAAMKADKARTQNFTVAVSFGVERDAAFEHAQTKTVISMPQPNGTIYTFGKDVNILWRHGILQVPPEHQSQQGRISIIAWGWIPQFEL